MDGAEDPVKKERVVEARARNISHNVRCTECGSQSIEDSQADIAILLRKLGNKNCEDQMSNNETQKSRSDKVVNPHNDFKISGERLSNQEDLRSAKFKPKLIRDEIRDGKSDKEIYKKLGEEYGETVLYAPKFDLQTAGLWLSPILAAGVAGGMWAYKKHRQKTNVHIMALNLVRGVPLTPREKETMLDVLTPPPPEGASFWWRRWLHQ